MPKKMIQKGWTINLIVVSILLHCCLDWAREGFPQCNDLLPVSSSMYGYLEVMLEDLEMLGGLKWAAWELLLVVLVALVELK
eukprot:14198765-Ditylum_brightwellii.AAC.1